MKTVGIICEYNPFHLGHQRQIDQIRKQFGKDTAIICVMSGNFVQRGMPAMWDKFTRARAAVSCGADLVLELPVTKVLQSAEGFARGGVELLTHLGVVDILCFGAECADTETLMTLAKKADIEKDIFQKALAKGLPYAAAKQLAANDRDNILSFPNNILAVEYCRALLHFNSPLIPFAIKRHGNYHDTVPDDKEPSATSVRGLFPHGDWQTYIPLQAVQHFEHALWYEAAFGERAMMARLRGMSDKEWETCAHGSEGLWSKAMKSARRESSIEGIISATKSKRYPRTRIQRLLLCAYLGITSHDLETTLPYSRILCASENGRPLIRQIKKTGTLPLVNPGQLPPDKDYYRIETRASDLFTLFCSTDEINCQMEQNTRLKL